MRASEAMEKVKKLSRIINDLEEIIEDTNMADETETELDRLLCAKQKEHDDLLERLDNTLLVERKEPKNNER